VPAQTLTMSLATLAGAAAALLLTGAAAFLLWQVVRTRRLAGEAERRVPRSGRLANIEGHDIHYVVAGEGPPILFLHGLGGQLMHFRGTLFDRLAPDYRLVAVDRPGSGYSRRAGETGSRISEQARILASLIDELGLEQPLVVGHSLGGAVALALAIDHPDRVGGLALIAPLTHLFDKVPPAFAPLYIEAPWKRRLLAATVGVPASFDRAQQTLDFVFGPQKAPDSYFVEGGGWLSLRPAHLEATIADMVAIVHDLGRYEARYGELAVPVGVLFGTADRVLDPSVHIAPLQDRVRDLTVELLDGIGHMPQFVATERVEAFVRKMAARSLDYQ
jgi:pimeloyl-ACP methyl ester carboxylesterase